MLQPIVRALLSQLFHRKGVPVESQQWWLMWASFPDLNWARLRVFADGKADVFDMDGRTMTFRSETEARDHLLEDEFTRYDRLGPEDEEELGRPVTSIKPPSAANDWRLVARMYVKGGK